MQELVSVVIPHWSPPHHPIGREALNKCLDSIMKQTYPHLEVIVVNNEGRGTWTEEFERRYPRSRWIHNQENRLFAGAMNQGIAMSQGEFILALNNDVELTADFIQRVMKGMKDGGKIGMGCGLLLSGNRIDSAGQLLSRAKRPHERGHGQLYQGQFHQQEQVFGPAGACGMYRRGMLEAVSLSSGGYFDEDFGFFYEDLELAWRAQKKKWKAVYIPEAVAYHARGLTLKNHQPRWRWLSRFYAANLGREHLARLIRNRKITLRRHCRLREWIFHWPWIFAYDLGLRILFHSKVAAIQRAAMLKKKVNE